MTMPGFSAESSFGYETKNYSEQATRGEGARGSQVVPQGCFTINGRSCCCYFGYCWCTGHIIRAHA
jgi:hypothetical protein